MSNHTATYSPEDDKIRITPAYRLDKETEYARVKRLGFQWAPMQKVFYAVWSPDREDLALEMCGEIEDEDKSFVERAEDRAARFSDYSASRREDAEQAHKAVAAIADNIPMGQPILVGHHSEKRARRDAEKIQNGMRRAVQMWDQANYWKNRAADALAHAKYKERPDVRGRRIKTLESELRKLIASYTPHLWKDGPLKGQPQRILQQDWNEVYPHNGTPGNKEAEKIPHVFVGPAGRGGHWVAERNLERIKARAQRWEEHISNRLEYESAMLGEQIGVDAFSQRFDYAIGGKIKVRREDCLLTILKLNKKDGQIVSVSTNSRRWTRVVPLEDILEYTPPEDGAAELVKAATKRPTLCNYPGEGFATCTAAQWAKIPKDYKSQSHVIQATETHGAHCVRWAIGVWLDWSSMPLTDHDRQYCDGRKHRYYPVFITDEKRKDPPRLTPDEPPKVPQVEPIAPTPEQLERMRARTDRREEAKAEAAPFEAIRESLKTGVHVVSAPQLFPTPAHIARRMVELAEIEPGECVLEPSAGTGALIQAVVDSGVDTEILGYEINRSLYAAIASKWPPYRVKVVCADFLEVTDFQGCYPKILMNPPFENGSDIKHIMHALKFLKPGGRLVAICANGPRQQDKLQPLCDSWEELPAGTFEGTQVRAVLLTMTKEECDHVELERARAAVEAGTFTVGFAPESDLHETQQEALQHVAGGRSWQSLKPSKQFDKERAETGPLFERRLF